MHGEETGRPSRHEGERATARPNRGLSIRQVDEVKAVGGHRSCEINTLSAVSRCSQTRPPTAQLPYGTSLDADKSVLRSSGHFNTDPACRTGAFQGLAEHYLKVDFGTDAVRPKSVNTIPIVEHYVRDYLSKRFGNQIAEDVKPLEIQKWLKFLNESNGLAWTTIARCGESCTASTRSAFCTNSLRKIRAACRDALKVQLPGYHHHPSSYACDPEILCLTASFRASADLRRDRAALVGDSGAQMERHIVGRRTNKDFKTLGQGKRRRDQDRRIGRVRPDASCSGRTSSQVASTDAAREAGRFCFSVN